MDIDIECDDVLKRLADLYGVSTDVELAEKLEVAPQTISTWRSRNKVPFEKVVEASARSSVSLNLLIFGEPSKEECGYVNPELLGYLFKGLDAELFLSERIADNSGGFDLLCRAYNAVMLSSKGSVDMNDPRFIQKADVAMKDVISFHNSMLEFISSTRDRPTTKEIKGNRISQTIHGSNHEIAGRDIVNKGKKGK